jgi:hypothetical protein
MRNENSFCVVRRTFLRFGIVGGLLGVLGCDSGAVQEVTTPPVQKGNRSRLDSLKGKFKGEANKEEKGKEK